MTKHELPKAYDFKATESRIYAMWEAGGFFQPHNDPNKPGFDPNLFVDGIDPANWEAYNESPDKPLLNRPLRGAYPPGSTIKPFLALAALTSGKRTPAMATHDPGFFQLPGSSYRFRDDKPGGHGTVDMYKSIVVSCDTYYYVLASETPIDDQIE